MEDSFLYRPLVMMKDFSRDLKNALDTTYRTEVMHNYKAIFFYIHKNATTSLRSIFKGEQDIVNKRNLDKFKDYFKFAFVRNPFDRLVSCYLYSCRTNREKNRRSLIRDKNGKIVRRDFFNFNAMFYPRITFEEFVEGACKMPDRIADEHFRSQFFSLSCKDRLIPNFLGKIENLREDYKKICEIIGMENPPKLPHKNKSVRDKDYREYYNARTKHLVAKRYKKDLEAFEYEF